MSLPEQVTKCVHTGELESVHSLYNKYATKRKKYGQQGYTALLHLAALDHNHAVDRQQAQTKSGRLRYKLQYSKASGDYVVKPVKDIKQHQYRHEILLAVTDRCQKGNNIV